MSSVRLPDLCLELSTDFCRTSHQAPCKQVKRLTPKQALRNEQLGHLDGKVTTTHIIISIHGLQQ